MRLINCLLFTLIFFSGCAKLELGKTNKLADTFQVSRIDESRQGVNKKTLIELNSKNIRITEINLVDTHILIWEGKVDTSFIKFDKSGVFFSQTLYSVNSRDYLNEFQYWGGNEYWKRNRIAKLTEVGVWEWVKKGKSINVILSSSKIETKNLDSLFYDSNMVYDTAFMEETMFQEHTLFYNLETLEHNSTTLRANPYELGDAIIKKEIFLYEDKNATYLYNDY